MTKRMGLFGLCAIALLSVASVASAQFSIHNGAYLVNDAEKGTVVEIASLTTWPAPGFGGHWQYAAPANLFFDQLTELRYDYRFLAGSNYAPGSPRVMVELDVLGTLKYVEIHFTAPVTTTWTTDNVLASPEARFNLTDFGGPYYATFAEAKALIGPLAEVTYIWIPVDGGWQAPQYVRLDNFTVNGVTADAKFVVETRNQATIGDLNGAVTNAHNLTVALLNNNAYVNLAKTADGQAWAAHNAAAGVGYFTAADFPAALAKYKQYRYQQATYNGRAAQYLAYAGAPGNGAPKTAHTAAKTYGTVDFNAP